MERGDWRVEHDGCDDSDRDDAEPDHPAHRDRADPCSRSAASTAAATTEMTHRSTIVTRVHTDEGIVGEAYAGDEDAGAARDRRDHPRRDRAAARRRGRVGHRALLGARPPRDLQHPARPAARACRARLRRHRALGRDRQGARPAALAALGRLPGQPADDLDRRLLRRPDADIAEEVERAARARHRRDEVQGRRRSPPTRTRSASASAREAAGDDFVLAADANQGWTRERGARASRASSTTSSCAGSRSRAAGTTTAARCATCGSMRRRPGLRRAERVLRRRLPRPDGRGRDRRLQLRRLVVGRPDRVAARRRRWRCRYDVDDGPSRGAPGRRAPARARSRTAPTSSASTPIATRSGGTSSPTGRRSSTGRTALPDGPGLGWELDEDYIEHHRVARP